MNIDSKLPEDGRKIEYPAKNYQSTPLFKVKAIENKHQEPYRALYKKNKDMKTPSKSLELD